MRIYEIGEELKAFVESGVAVLVGTGDAARRPRVDHGWGPRVRPDHTTIDVFLDTARADRALSNLRANAKIAMTVADPVSYRSVQLKGSYREDGAASDDDLAWVQRHRDAFIGVTSLVGDPPQAIRNLWMTEVIRVAFVVDSAFDQTPGPGAGKPL